ncbi:polysaccharide biosynthesis protein [Geobacillus sp. 46C-IIa]|uniref:putative polysaccharide biosynthesis protein n=1 Tax=Geobacillus sp. 46C-IIa TaxID=1963025 RepID=UPI0009BCF853|nr:polysaccharide biosynthesis protein [Geobacillus sp. 46C-IIa]OQP04416.1 polysaccharide biosynthesis protein [Geobacillus sp. 46C-IIa]QNU27843.1 oligosaccharide flippase family protein [Geobacillus sp. 46C-IIa]
MGNVWKGAAVLTVAALLTKLLSALYRVPYQNMVGDVGFYIYQQVYPIYGIVVALSLAGYPVAISKLIAERLAEGDEAGAAAVRRVALPLLSALGMMLFAVLYAGAEAVASWMGDRRLEPLLRLLSFSFLFFPLIAVLRGDFQGRHDMVPTAVSQVGEQLVRVAAILGLSYWALRRGADVYSCGMAAIAGTLGGMAAALLILLFYAAKRGRKKTTGRTPPVLVLHMGQRLLTAGTIVCLTNMALTLIPLVDSFLFVPLLRETGAKLDEVKWLKGVYDRGQPLIQLGTVAGTSLSLALVPFISGTRRGQGAAFTQGLLPLRIAAVIGVGASLGLICLIRPINTMLFENDRGSIVLAVLSASIFFTTMALTASAMLQGMGKEWAAAAGVAVAVAGKMALMHWLVPPFGVLGAAFATTGAYAFMACFLYVRLRRECQLAHAQKYVYPIVKAGVAMVVVLQLYRWLIDASAGGRLWAAAEALGGVAVGAIVYIVFIVKGNVFSEQELSALPLANKFRLLLGSR